MRYGKSNFQPGDYGYYDPDTHTAHLWGGKTETTRKYVHFEVHSCVSAAIDLHHSNIPASVAWVFPLKNGGQSTTDPLRTILHDTYFKEGNPYGFPANINPTDFRHLYETHVRHVLKLPEAELDEIMKTIGHSHKTSVENYSETYNVPKN
jgi:integrase